MSKITYQTKTTGDTFSGAEATEIKTVVNANDDALIALNTRTSNVDNTADADKPVSTAQGTAIATAKSEAIAASIPTSEKGAANGVATLGADGTLPIAQSSKLGTVVPVNTPAVAGMNPQQTAEALQGQLNPLVSEWDTLTYGATVAWDCENKVEPKAKLTATGDFTINMTNVANASEGVLKIITSTASAVTITFDADFTNKKLNVALPTYTLPAGTGKEYFLYFILDGTTIEWSIKTTDITMITTSSSFTRPSNTNAYAAKDVVSNATSSPASKVFSGVMPSTGGNGSIVKARISVSSNATTSRFRLNLFNASPTQQNDNAQYVELFANASARIGYIDFPATSIAGSGSDCCEALADNIMLAFVLTGADLYYELETLDAFTPTSAEQVFVSITTLTNN